MEPSPQKSNFYLLMLYVLRGIMKKNELIQRSLILFKPDAVKRGLVGEILNRFERVGLKIIGMKMVKPNKAHYYKHYEDIGKVVSRRGEKVFNELMEYMLSEPIIAVALEGVEAVSVIRKLVGATESKAAAPGTIRGDYSHISFAYGNIINAATANLVHASGDPEEARLEVAHWFSDAELFEYKTCADKYIF